MRIFPGGFLDCKDIISRLSLNFNCPPESSSKLFHLNLSPTLSFVILQIANGHPLSFLSVSVCSSPGGPSIQMAFEMKFQSNPYNSNCLILCSPPRIEDLVTAFSIGNSISLVSIHSTIYPRNNIANFEQNRFMFIGAGNGIRLVR